MADISKITIDSVEYNVKDATARDLINNLEGSAVGNADTLDGMHATEFASSGHTHSVASEAAAGFMSKADKSALNNLKTLVGETAVAEQITNAVNGKADSEHTHSASDISGTIPINKGGTGAANGATGLKNLLAAGGTILSEHQYGTLGDRDNLEPVKGRIFFVKA